jgi:hypothetical protein
VNPSPSKDPAVALVLERAAVVANVAAAVLTASQHDTPALVAGVVGTLLGEVAAAVRGPGVGR